MFQHFGAILQSPFVRAAQLLGHPLPNVVDCKEVARIWKVGLDLDSAFDVFHRDGVGERHRPGVDVGGGDLRQRGEGVERLRVDFGFATGEHQCQPAKKSNC